MRWACRRRFLDSLAQPVALRRVLSTNAAAYRLLSSRPPPVSRALGWPVGVARYIVSP